MNYEPINPENNIYLINKGIIKAIHYGNTNDGILKCLINVKYNNGLYEQIKAYYQLESQPKRILPTSTPTKNSASMWGIMDILKSNSIPDLIGKELYTVKRNFDSEPVIAISSTNNIQFLSISEQITNLEIKQELLKNMVFTPDMYVQKYINTTLVTEAFDDYLETTKQVKVKP